jgi:hypothetical protein
VERISIYRGPRNILYIKRMLLEELGEGISPIFRGEEEISI